MNMLANNSLFTHSADTEQHEHPVGVVQYWSNIDLPFSSDGPPTPEKRIWVFSLLDGQLSKQVPCLLQLFVHAGQLSCTRLL